jgi:ribosomal protein S18 acetylase RimI-like enzyme
LNPTVDTGLLEAIDRPLVEFYLAARSRPWADIKIDDDVVWGSTGLPLAAFNGATLATFTPESADRRIASIVGYFRELRLDMSWRVGPTSTPADLGDRLIAGGLVHEESMPGMAASLVDWAPPSTASGIEVELVTDVAGFHAAIDIMFEGFELPADIQPAFEERYVGFALGPRAIQRTYLGRLDGVPVATSLGFVVDNIVGVYNVATLEGARRRGVGSAVTAAAMSDGAAVGATTAVLESSEMGRSVYERLGFCHVTDIAIYLGRFTGSAIEPAGL